MKSSTKDKANYFRKEIMRVACANNAGHIAPSLSCLDILVVLYYKLLSKQDTIVLSKGHGCYGVYAIEHDLGHITDDMWEYFNLPGCLEGFGSLGHGLPIAVGRAYGNLLQGLKGHTYCIVGDGEMQEGSMWEALSFLRHHKLQNITVIVDNNGLQAMDRVENVLSQRLFNRFQGWGFDPVICDGHNHDDLIETLSFKPAIVIADTIKGKGYPAMENVAKFHYRIPNDAEKQCA